MVGDLTNNNDEIDQLGDLVEKELSSMDKAIEEVSLVEHRQYTYNSSFFFVDFRRLNKLWTC